MMRSSEFVVLKDDVSVIDTDTYFVINQNHSWIGKISQMKMKGNGRI